MTQWDESEARRVLWIRRLTGVFFLLLLASTWPLWTPHGQVPQVPAFVWMAGLPLAVDWICLAIVILACAAWTLSRRYSRVAACCLLVFLALLLLLDQLRWQPWALQAWLVVAVIALTTPGRAVRLLQWLTIGIYFHSAIAKLDHAFAHTIGQQFLATVLGGVGARAEDIPADSRLWLSMTFPVVELIVATLLCFRRTVRLGVGGAVAMHVLTLLILGPWGLKHQWGVLIWNVWLAIQAPVLFWPLKGTTIQTATGAGYRNILATALVLAALLLPFSTRLGWWDTWPSWGLYAPGAERATVWVHELGVARLAPELQPYVRGNQTWRRFRLDRWVLTELDAPIYPQSRVQLALATSIADRFQLGDLIRVEMATPVERWTGQRGTHSLDNRAEINDAAISYWFNASVTRWPGNRDGRH